MEALRYVQIFGKEEDLFTLIKWCYKASKKKKKFFWDNGKTIALTRRTFVGKIMSQLFNMLSRLVIGEGDSTPLQYSCLENPMDGGAWWAAVHGVARSWTWLSNFTLFFHFHALEKEMATHSSVLAWRIPGTGEAGGLPSMGSHRVGHDWSNLAAAAAAAAAP